MASAITPARTLSSADAIFVILGLVIGAGIFKAPSLVAANTPNDWVMLGLWLAGGALALVGALCYAELASAHPSTGGDFHYIQRAFGRPPAFLFAWARLSVMQTGSIALLAFVFGDYASQIASLGEYSAAIYAALAVMIFTGFNVWGIREGTRAQRIFTLLELSGILIIVLCGLAMGDAPMMASTPSLADSLSPGASIGLAMVFVLLTYGGWNEAAYISAELRGERTAIARVLIISIAAITAVYVLINFAYLKALGHAGMAASEAVAADALRGVLGEHGARLVSLIVAISALTSINATIITGARCNQALGSEFPRLRYLSRWNDKTHTPSNALIVQGAVAIALVALGAATRSGFSTLVEYTAPVFWCFFLLTGLALFRLRWKEPHHERPFRVPLYPLTPVVFCASSAYMLWSSLNYAGIGALVGVAVLCAGIPVLWFMRRQPNVHHAGGVDHEYSPPIGRVRPYQQRADD